MKLKTYTTLALAAVALATVPAFAQVQISRDGRPERIFRPISGLNGKDIQFLQQAAIINIFEMKVGQLASEKSTNQFISEFGKEMITDHKMAWDELKTIAAAKDVNLPQDLPAELQHLLAHLENLSPGQFDMAFQNAQRNGHAMASEKFKSEIENGKDEDVKGYAVKNLPTVEMHYRMMLNKETMMGPTKMSHGD